MPPIELPDMPPKQQRAWEALFDIYDAIPYGWVLVGGQAVYLHAIEREAATVRPTDDADAALDVRAHPTMLQQFTEILLKLGFVSAGESMEGHQHRWLRGPAIVDVLIPRWLGERAESRTGATGGTTIAAPASQQALDRTETVSVSAGGRTGLVNRTSLLGSLVGKAAAIKIPDDGNRERHVRDFLTLASVLRATDFRGIKLGPSDIDHLRNMLGQLANSPDWMNLIPDSSSGVERVRLILPTTEQEPRE